MTLTIVAQITAADGAEELVRSELEKLIPITRAEKGCITYVLHKNNERPAHFLFYEEWETRDLWRAHMEAPHLASYMKATEGFVADFQLFEMSKIA